MRNVVRVLVGLALVGLVVASLLLGVVIAAPADGGRLLGYSESPQGRIDLFAEPGPCVGKARRASFAPAEGGAEVPGCWVPGAGVVLVVFFDGDIATLPAAAIAPAKES